MTAVGQKRSFGTTKGALGVKRNAVIVYRSRRTINANLE